MERKVITNNSLGFFRDQLETFLNGGWNLIVGSLVVTDNRQFAIVERNKPVVMPTVVPTTPPPTVLVAVDFKGNYRDAITQALKEFPNRQTQKISAIKRLRELCPGLGLAEAKAAIEAPEAARDHFKKHKKPLPYY